MLSGCLRQQTRSQSDDEPADYKIETLRDMTSVSNAAPLPVGGVGLVEGLEGTGGEAPPDDYRTMLEQHLRKHGVQNVKELMQSKNHALVLVSGLIQPGSAKGERFDIEVRLPERSSATSLRGGHLRDCVLFYYNTTNNLKPGHDGPNSMLRGHDIARASGKIEVGFGSDDGGSQLRQGRIWNGGRTLTEMPMGLTMNPDHQYATLADLVARRVNDTFAGSRGITPSEQLAVAHNSTSITLRVPRAYRLNLPRYLRVVLLIPREPVLNLPGRTDVTTYGQQLADDLLDPARTVTAALRLEALGENSITTLKTGLQSDNVLVRFCSAEAITYLGSSAGLSELTQIAQTHPKLRSLALTALASLNEASAQGELRRLMETSGDDELRYGAFHALRLLNDKHPALHGEMLNQTFSLHKVASAGNPFVHFNTGKRPEVVLFGEGMAFRPPVPIVAGEFTLTAQPGDDRMIIGRFHSSSVHPFKKDCSMQVEDVLRTMADMGASYADVVEVLRQANDCRCMTSHVRFNALPQAVTAYDLVKAGKEGLATLGIDQTTPPTTQPTTTLVEAPAKLHAPAPRGLTAQEIAVRAEAMLNEPAGQGEDRKAER
jgi:hypothetical protein